MDLAEKIAQSPEQFARANGIELCYDTFGDRGDPPLLLIMGLGAQMILWDERFCEQLADHGFRVIRFDNRDVGRSTILREAPVPSTMALMLRDKRAAAYSLDDMAADAVGLLDHLEIPAAHVVGVSMGGMIAQLIALNAPDRVLSLVSIMSTTGNRRVGSAHPRLWPRLLRRPQFERSAYIEDFLTGYQMIGSRRYPPDPDRKRAQGGRCFDRGIHPAGAARQLAAIIAAPDRTERLRRLSTPTTVIHGDADPLVNVSGGRATAQAVPGARLVVIPGMGHDMPPALWPVIIEAIVENAARVRPKADRAAS
jgi:pimeloyl-ACP methyl ester carboxylesterase